MRRARLFLALAAALRCGAAAACADLRVHDAWVADAPPGAPVRVGYAVLENAGAVPLLIDRIDGGDFDAVAPHRMSVVDGIMQMRPLPRLEVPAHGRLALQAGGDHLMLSGPHRALQPGDSTALVFHCGAHAITVPFAVHGATP